jgi:hypothetical protein
MEATSMEKLRGAPGMLDFPCDVERLPNGNTLITDAGDELALGSEIIEVDPVGAVVWYYNEGLAFAHSAKRLENGNTLITDTTNNRVIEVTPEKEIVFTSDDWGDGSGTLSDGSHLNYPNDAHAVEGDRLMITDRNNNRCLITDRQGNVLWEYSKDIHHPHNCDLLPNGNVIIADSDNNRAIEVNPEKKIVWTYGGTTEELNWPRDADKLENGNVLCADSKNSRVIEVNPDGKIVWCYKADHFAMFYDADKLPNGNVLASDQFHRQVLEIDPFGNIVWQFRNNRTLYPILPRMKNGAFKEWTEHDEPADWMALRKLSEGKGEVIWETNDKGRRFPGLAYDGTGVLGLFQVIGLVPGKRYTFTGNIKTEGVEETGAAFFSMGFMDSLNGYLADVADAPKGDLYTGTNDWTPEKIEFTAPDNATSLELRLLLKGKGRAWMKSLMLFS